jgi:hypothetical protein
MLQNNLKNVMEFLLKREDSSYSTDYELIIKGGRVYYAKNQLIQKKILF